MRAARRTGFSLLETLLAAGILLGCLIVLGHLATLGRRSALAAEELAEAQRICQTRLNEIVVGLRPLEPVDDSPLDDEPGWRWSVEMEPAKAPGMVSLRVTVIQDVPEGKHARRFALVRWVRDPNAAEAQPDAAAAPGELP
jgi:type II secretory pathway pseudopilin PulG